MTEQCQKCKREEQRYIILEIVEFDVGGSAEREEEDVTDNKGSILSSTN
jgi:hypothetical protein